MGPGDLPERKLGWLADAPLFIDADQVGRFYDAVAMPPYRYGPATYQDSSKLVGEVAAKIAAKGGADVGQVAAWLLGLFPGLSAELAVEGSGKVGGERQWSNSYVTQPIFTPQRDLVLLALHYLNKHPERVFFASTGSDLAWCEAQQIRALPRALVFLDLPGNGDADGAHPPVKLIPTAAEFGDGNVVILYPELRHTDKEARITTEPPAYEERGSPEELRLSHREYWEWFDTHYSARQAMQVVEQAASAHGRIRWIDYRIRLTTEGHTLHLHFAPGGQYDTGTFAYNLIKRGFKHGLRLVGTLKSEPDMNVLAVYEK